MVWQDTRKGYIVKLRNVCLTLICAAAVSASTATAAGPAWTPKDMKTAIHALGYPKPHPKKLSCKGLGAASGGRFDSFRCVATYRLHHRRVFYTAGRGEGGWLCAGKTAAACGLLKRGFVTSADVARLQSMGAAADLAARGYLMNRGETYTPVHFCQQAGGSWVCPFTVNGTPVTVTITFKGAKGGFVLTGSAA